MAVVSFFFLLSLNGLVLVCSFVFLKSNIAYIFFYMIALALLPRYRLWSIDGVILKFFFTFILFFIAC